MATEDEIHQLRTDVAHLTGQVTGQAEHLIRIDKWLQSISQDLRRPDRNATPIYVGILMVVSVLITLGTFALKPVSDSVNEVSRQIETLRAHDADGHPDAVLRLFERLDYDHKDDHARMLRRFNEMNDMVNKLTTRQAELFVIANERTDRFVRTMEQRDKIAEMRSIDRLTGSEHKLYAQGVENRLKRLEQDSARGRRHSGSVNDN